MNAADVKNKTWFGALTGAVKALCMLIIKGVNVADSAVSMADKAVTVARTKQAIDLGIDMKDYATKAVNNAALKLVKDELAIRDFIGDDKEKQALMTKAKETMSKAVQEALAEVATSAE